MHDSPTKLGHEPVGSPAKIASVYGSIWVAPHCTAENVFRPAITNSSLDGRSCCSESVCDPVIQQCRRMRGEGKRDIRVVLWLEVGKNAPLLLRDDLAMPEISSHSCVVRIPGVTLLVASINFRHAGILAT